jgi:hypothetical protein
MKFNIWIKKIAGKAKITARKRSSSKPGRLQTRDQSKVNLDLSMVLAGFGEIK